MLLALGKIGTPCCFVMPARIAATDPFKQIGEYVGSGPMRFAKRRPDRRGCPMIFIIRRARKRMRIESGGYCCDHLRAGFGVPSSGPKWRARRDSNSCPPDS
jgi:hypothetical protein